MESDEYNVYEELQLDLLSVGGPGFGKGEDDEDKESDTRLGEESSPMSEPLSSEENLIPTLPSVPSTSNAIPTPPPASSVVVPVTTNTTTTAAITTTTANISNGLDILYS